MTYSYEGTLRKNLSCEPGDQVTRTNSDGGFTFSKANQFKWFIQLEALHSYLLCFQEGDTLRVPKVTYFFGPHKYDVNLKCELSEIEDIEDEDIENEGVRVCTSSSSIARS